MTKLSPKNDYTLSTKEAKKLIEDSCHILLTDHGVRQLIYRKKIKAVKVLGSIKISVSSLHSHIRVRRIA